MSENDRDYDQVIIKVFQGLITHYGTDSNRLPFTMVDIRNAAADLGLVIQNFPDVTYTYRVGRSTLPAEIQAYGNWAIEGAGKGKYAFVKLTRDHAYIQIPTDFEITPILDATPLIVLKYQKSDEQALLAQLRYTSRGHKVRFCKALKTESEQGV
jgi:hypothetical protein